MGLFDMAKLNQIIKPLSGFQYSVNIFYDIYDENKIKSYIPSNSSLQIIEDILASTENRSTDRARILTGAYGKGKSHLVLCLLALLSGRKKELFDALIIKANSVNKNLARNIEAYLDSGKKLLPVIVNANSMDIKSTLLQSLSYALEKADLSKIMPTTFFDVAANKINDWKISFPSTYAAFEKKVGAKGTDFIADLNAYNQTAYELFVKIYPQLTSGSEFNPMAGSDVISVYESVIIELKKYGYSGIYIVYDEFGKFLEGSVDKSSAMDIKIIQDLAEKCNRSGDKQLHILLISHKSIDNYIGRLSKVKVDAWKAVSNRFKPISINNTDSEIYDMVATVLQRDDEKFANYIVGNQDKFKYLQNYVDKDIMAFGKVRNVISDTFVFNCYPLHPYSLLLLPKVSELVAQNERTIFTFLSSTERYSVPYFLRVNEDDFPIIEPDYIYDYFEKLFKGEPYGSEIKKQWQIATNALSKIKEAENELAEKIVKTIALIYCVNDFETIPPSWDLIQDIYSVNYSLASIQSAKEVLKNNHILIELLYKPWVRLSEGSGHNVIELIKQEQYKIENKINIKDILLEISDNRYFYPIQYNDENEITRYFALQFIFANEINDYDFNNVKANEGANGFIYAVIIRDETERQVALDAIKAVSDKCSIFVLPLTPNNVDNIVTEYKAITNLIKLYTGKEISLIDELQFILEDRGNVLKSYIDKSFLKPELSGNEYYYLGDKQDITRKANLSKLLSDIMASTFDKTPIIVNELIVKNILTPTIRGARQKILVGILAGNYKKDMGLVGNGPEQNILRSTLITPNIFINSDTPSIKIDGADEKFYLVLVTIRDFVKDSTKNSDLTFSDLYDKLTLSSYGFGLKKGVIPIYIAIILAVYKEHIVVTKKGKELPVDAALVQDIEISPKDYKVTLEDWDANKDAYLANLEAIFSDDINISDRANGQFVSIARAMRRWYLQLSRYDSSTKYYCDEHGEVKELDKEVIKFRNILSTPELNAHELIFEKLLKCFSTNDYNDVIIKVREAHTYLSHNIDNHKRRMVMVVRNVFEAAENESLVSTLKNFYDDLKQSTKEHLFSGQCMAFINIIKEPNRNEEKIIEDIARAIFNLRIGDFTDSIMSSFESEVKAIRNNILQYDTDVTKSSNVATGYKIVYLDENGNEVTRQFDKVEYSNRSQLLYNEITSQIAEYGEAISADEKRQVLFNILKELI